MSPTGPSPGLFFETINGFQRTQALRSAIEIDLFSHLADGPETAEVLAERCQAAVRGVRILADYLSIVGFLAKSGDRYALTPDTAMFLTRQSPAYLGGTVEFLLTPSLVDCYQQLPAAVRKGGTAVSDEGTVSENNPVWVDFARAMSPLMQLPAQLLVGLIGGETSQPLRVLDVAAGHGLFGITVAQRYPQSQITALDWHNVLTVAHEHACQAGVQERYQLRPGSAFDTDWGGPYDVVLLTNFFHHFDEPTCEQIAGRARAALAPGGRAITLEFIPNEDRITPPMTATFALTMLATTARGDAYTFAQYDQIFTQAGFRRNEFHPLPPTMQQAIVSYRD
ncbi:MAG: class I SAM-dependent methyltransferase [Planctomycetes bacterium]|nr:class I SAM-dependent methyltransferase [Planctomycetota bacterium]